jgi:hypothetical protein
MLKKSVEERGTSARHAGMDGAGSSIVGWFQVRLTRGRLAQVGVEMIKRTELVLTCLACNSTWTQAQARGYRLPRYWWRCPNGCNPGATSAVTANFASSGRSSGFPAW